MRRHLRAAPGAAVRAAATTLAPAASSLLCKLRSTVRARSASPAQRSHSVPPTTTAIPIEWSKEGAIAATLFDNTVKFRDRCMAILSRIYLSFCQLHKLVHSKNNLNEELENKGGGELQSNGSTMEPLEKIGDTDESCHACFHGNLLI